MTALEDARRRLSWFTVLDKKRGFSIEMGDDNADLLLRILDLAGLTIVRKESPASRG